MSVDVLKCPCCDEPMVQRIFEPSMKQQLLKKTLAPIHFYYCRSCEYSVLCNKQGVVPSVVRWTELQAATPSLPPAQLGTLDALREPRNRGMDAWGRCTRCGHYIDSTSLYCPNCDGG